SRRLRLHLRLVVFAFTSVSSSSPSSPPSPPSRRLRLHLRLVVLVVFVYAITSSPLLLRSSRREFIVDRRSGIVLF
ncbi:Uncharacterized protein APZ42_004411, partial [Daphnia magna]